MGGACLYRDIFCAVQNYGIQKELWYPKRKLGVTMHFSEIIKLQFGKGHQTLLGVLKAFYRYCSLMIFEKCVVTPNFLFGFQ